MPDPLLALSTRRTIQTQPIPGRAQVANSAGGYVFQVDDWTRLHRFLVIGTTGGTYYVGERELTRDNADVLFRLIDQDGPRVVRHVVEVSVSGDAPKQQPCLFALAACASVGDEQTKQAALDALPQVCRTGTHLFQWNAYAEGMRGWGRARARAVARWYLRDLEKVTHQAVKYRQRDGWTHRDLLRLAHPKADGPGRAALFDFICGRTPERGALPLVDAYLRVQEPDVTEEMVVVLVALGLPWEALPDRWINSPAVWDALLDGIGLTALLRNLPRLTRLGLVKPLAPLPAALSRLTDVEQLRKARIHPVAVLNALFGYRSGTSRGGQTWTPVPAVVDLLDDAFHESFGAINPAGKRTLVALDVSGSMGWENLAALPALTPRDASAAMAMATVRTEPAVMVVAFTGGHHRGMHYGSESPITPLPITGRQRLDDVVRTVSNLPMGPTDCALPMLWAAEQGIEVDTFVTFTDNETWAGGMHPTQALAQYRQKTGIPARLAVSAMTSTGFSIADPQDAGQLDLVGFDAAAPHLLSEFSRGEL